MLRKSPLRKPRISGGTSLEGTRIDLDPSTNPFHYSAICVDQRVHVVPRLPTPTKQIAPDNSPVISTPEFSCGRVHKMRATRATDDRLTAATNVRRRVVSLFAKLAVQHVQNLDCNARLLLAYGQSISEFDARMYEITILSDRMG